MIQEIFGIDKERFERLISGIGNDRCRCMAAVVYSYHKNIFYFILLSRMRFNNDHQNLTDVLQVLKEINTKIVIL